MVPNPIKMDDLGVPLFLETPICFSNLLLVSIPSGYAVPTSNVRWTVWGGQEVACCPLVRLFLEGVYVPQNITPWQKRRPKRGTWELRNFKGRSRTVRGGTPALTYGTYFPMV